VWQSVDPLADKYPGLSGYSYVFNSPINYIDPDGRDAILIVFPDYKIEAYGRKWSGLGHAGVLLIDNKTGYTRYYEYGRYESDRGEVRNVRVPNVKIGKDGKPTVESLNKVLAKISKASGKGGKIEGAYIKSDKFDEMRDYAEGRLKENSNSERKSYDIQTNNCGTFACDVVKQDETVKDDAPGIVDPRPTSVIDEYRGTFDKVDYDPKNGTKITPTKTLTEKAKDFIKGFFNKQD